jgi:hypothetical protein
MCYFVYHFSLERKSDQKFKANPPFDFAQDSRRLSGQRTDIFSLTPWLSLHPSTRSGEEEGSSQIHYFL